MAPARPPFSKNHPSANQNLESVSRSGIRAKKNRILRLYERCPRNSRVLCYDECGPLEIRPILGENWTPQGKPDRLPATYHRLLGTQQFLGFYDVRDDCLAGLVRSRKRSRDILKAFQRLRAVYSPRLRLYVVMDNLSAHKHPEILGYFKKQNMEPVWTPTYASWLNLIEAQFGGLKKFACRNSYPTSKRQQSMRIMRYLTYRNKKHGASRCRLKKLLSIKLERH